MIYPKTTGFHWGALDFQWYIESSQSRPNFARTPSGFHDVNRFITLEPHKGTDNVSIPVYVRGVIGQKKYAATTPIQVSEQIHAHADKALAILSRLSAGGDKELRLTLADIRTIAYLGKYYAHKIRGATELALHRETEEKAYQETAVRELTQAAQYWRYYASTALGQYRNPLWTNRVGHVDWRETFRHVLDDITAAGGARSLASMSPTPGGIVLEAETASSRGAHAMARGAGYTGTGYLEFVPSAEEKRVQWTFKAPAAGVYILEVRYAAEDGRHPAPMAINGEDAGALVLWTTGGPTTWAWDRKTVTFEEGPNTIALAPTGLVRVDHLNVLYAGPISGR
jgi:hypothetical protein